LKEEDLDRYVWRNRFGRGFGPVVRQNTEWMVAPTCFGITLPSSGSVPSALWDMINWGAVDRILHHVTRSSTPIYNILSTAPQLSISRKALGTLPEDDNVMPKHVGATIHN
jgi:hypothetical protein